MLQLKFADHTPYYDRVMVAKWNTVPSLLYLKCNNGALCVEVGRAQVFALSRARALSVWSGEARALTIKN